MSIEAGIGEKTEKAISNKNDKADLSSVFDDWKNNTSKAENQAERKSINDAVHKYLPNVSIINFVVGKTPSGEAEFVETYDSSTHKLEVRKVEDFSVVQSQDFTNGLKAQKMTDETVVQKLTEQVDNEKEESPEKKTEVNNNNSSNYQTNETESNSSVNTEVQQYQIQSGDSLWKIAQRHLAEDNKANGKPDAAISVKAVKAYVDKIVAANQEGDGVVKDPNLIYTGKTLNIPIEKKADTKSVPDPTNDTEKEPESKAPDSKLLPTKDSESTSVPTSELKFTAAPNTYDNPTIGSKDASTEAAVLKKYFAPMQKMFDYRSGNDELTQEEITEFVAKCKNGTASLNGQTMPTLDELAALENAAKHLNRIANVGFDFALGQGKGASSKDIENFERQENDFEGRYQARFYLEKHFDRIAPGKSEVTVAEIKEYRTRLTSIPQSADELKAVDNLLAQLAKSKVADSVVLNKANAKTAISEKVDGSSYEGYGGASYPATQVAAN
jgi:LysM repeat protein